MANYYEECLKKINTLIEENHQEEAKRIIDEELNLAYVPFEFEEKLKELKKELNVTKTTKYLTDEEIEAYIDGSENFQLLAVAELKKRNVRQYLDIIQKIFDSTKSEFVKISLLEICIEQQIMEELKMLKDGLEIHFIPAACTLPQDSDGFDLCVEYLQQWLENEDPILYNMCRQTALKEAYLHLPFEIEVEESEAMAYAIVMYVSELLGNKDDMKKLLSKKNASQNESFELLLYSNTI